MGGLMCEIFFLKKNFSFLSTRVLNYACNSYIYITWNHIHTHSLYSNIRIFRERESTQPKKLQFELIWACFSFEIDLNLIWFFFLLHFILDLKEVENNRSRRGESTSRWSALLAQITTERARERENGKRVSKHLHVSIQMGHGHGRILDKVSESI